MTATLRIQTSPLLRRLRYGCAVAFALAALAGCAGSRQEGSGLFAPYRTDLPQGNYITRERLDQVKPGMSRDQVRAVLGTPLLNPMFHDDRWDYVFRYQRPNGTAEQRRVVVRFKGDVVEAVVADDLPLREDPTDPALPGAKAAKSRAKAGSPTTATASGQPIDKEPTK